MGVCEQLRIELTAHHHGNNGIVALYSEMEIGIEAMKFDSAALVTRHIVERERQLPDYTLHNTSAAGFVPREGSLLDNDNSKSIRSQPPSRRGSGRSAADYRNVVLIENIFT